MTKRFRLLSTALALGAALVMGAGQGPAHADTITLHGAVQFDDNHAFNRAMLKFEDLVKQYYGGPDELEFVLHRNSELGLEKDYFAYMSQGISVDYAIVSPSHMSTFSKAAPLMDMPFLFRDLEILGQFCLEALGDELGCELVSLLCRWRAGTRTCDRLRCGGVLAPEVGPTADAQPWFRASRVLLGLGRAFGVRFATDRGR